MAVPKRDDLAKARQVKRLKVTNTQTTDKSRYLALKYDFDNNSLPEWKREEYFKLRDIYG